jgi:hypothetical protein
LHCLPSLVIHINCPRAQCNTSIQLHHLRVGSIHSRTGSSSSNTTTPGWSPLPCTSGIGNTGACFRPQHVARSGKPGIHLDSSGLTASTSASTLPFPPCLPQLHRHLSSTSTTALNATISASLPSTTIATTHLRHHHGASCAPTASYVRPSRHQRPDHNYVDLSHLQHGFFDHSFCDLALGYLDISTKGYNRISSLLVSTLRGRMLAFGFSSPLQCSRYDCGGMLYIW